MNSVKITAKRQFARFLDETAKRLAELQAPRGGWIRTMREALGMSAPDLAQRMGVTKAAIYQAERKEREGGVTINHMENIAEALGGRFVYAIVPHGTVNDLITAQARMKAEHMIKRASAHMALEKQSLSSEQLAEQIEQLADDLRRSQPPDFWKLR